MDYTSLIIILLLSITYVYLMSWVVQEDLAAARSSTVNQQVQQPQVV